MEAPGFDAKEECEVEFGALQCDTREALAATTLPSASASDVQEASYSGCGYVPVMWGYMISPSSSSSSRMGHPLIKHKNGGHSAFAPLVAGSKPSKAIGLNANGQKVFTGAYTPPNTAVPTAYRAPSMARDHSSSRGGFGGRSGGFGG